MGIMGYDPAAYLKGDEGRVGELGSLSAAQIDALLEERKQARDDKNFQRADEIRDTLIQQGIVLEDTAAGTSWRRA